MHWYVYWQVKAGCIVWGELSFLSIWVISMTPLQNTTSSILRPGSDANANNNEFGNKAVFWEICDWKWLHLLGLTVSDLIWEGIKRGHGELWETEAGFLLSKHEPIHAWRSPWQVSSGPIVMKIIVSFDIAPFPYKHAQRRITYRT